MKRRVLVTRPQPGASRTARLLADRGFEPIELPLTEIAALPAAIPTDIPDAVTVTSANALRHAPPLPDFLTRLPCFAVGGETAMQARAAGFVHVEQADGTAATLAPLIASRMHKGAHLLYLCGKVRTANFEVLLREAGLFVDSVETYDARPITHAPAQVKEILGSDPVDMVLLYSAVASECLCKLDFAAENQLPEAEFLCFAGRVATALKGIAATSQIHIAAEPSERALMELLELRAKAER